MIDLRLRKLIAAAQEATALAFNECADARDSAGREDRAQLRAVTTQTEKALAALETATRKAKL